MTLRRKAPHLLTLLSVPPLLALSVGEAAAAEYWVAPTGNDSNPGNMAQPFATLQKGHDTAVAGDTVWIRGGTYAITTPRTASAGITLTKSGTSDTNRINQVLGGGRLSSGVRLRQHDDFCERLHERLLGQR
jgi:hypothetical protein